MLGQQGMLIPCPASTWHQLLLLTPASLVAFPEMFCQVLNGMPSEKCISRQYYCMNTIEHVYIDLHSIAYKRLHGLAYFFSAIKCAVCYHITAAGECNTGGRVCLYKQKRHWGNYLKLEGTQQC